MYYHCLPLKYVEYGTITPHDDVNNMNRSAYAWLGQYCGYCPQIWLSRSDINITGYRGALPPRSGFGRERRARKADILFGFDQIHGFSVTGDFWWTYVLNAARYQDPTRPWEIDAALVARLDDFLNEAVAESGENLDPSLYSWEIGWRQERPNLAEFLRTHVFVESDQVVVPSLNLKTATRILCRNERQKKALRQMGFIEDRIEVRNTPRR